MRITVTLLGLLLFSGLLTACGEAAATTTPVVVAAATPVPASPTTIVPPSPTAVPPSPTVVPPSPTPLPPSATPEPPPTATLPPPPTATPGPAGIVTPKKLNVREGPGTKYSIVQTLTSGAPLNIIGQAVGLNWFKIRLPDGREGW